MGPSAALAGVGKSEMSLRLRCNWSWRGVLDLEYFLNEKAGSNLVSAVSKAMATARQGGHTVTMAHLLSALLEESSVAGRVPAGSSG